ncbi:MAG: 50S ribosomal protein L32e [Thermoplasmata archaeon]|nr:50S ribosomal protein L32e [Thermoplasmata archaeon]
MSETEKISEKLKELPHMTEEHMEVLQKHGLTTPKKLLTVLQDEKKWKEIHPDLKGIGPKTVEQWKEILEADKAEPKKTEEKPAPKKTVKKVAKKPVEKKEEKKKKEEAEEEAEEKEEVEIVEEGEYVPNKKPKLSPELKFALASRKIVSDNRPEFYRQEYGRYKRLRTGWRKPRGIHSKTRMKMRYRRPMVSVGYRGPRDARGLHSSGFEEVRVCNVNDLEKISNLETQAARIAHSVGQRKREKIIEKADELGIRVLNRS